jgi:hypothetical protein
MHMKSGALLIVAAGCVFDHPLGDELPLADGGADAGSQLLAGGPRFAGQLVADQTNLYWVTLGQAPVSDAGMEAVSQVLSVPKIGGAVTSLLTLNGTMWGIAVDDAYLYFNLRMDVYPPTGSILRLPKTGGAAETIVSGIPESSVVAVDDGFVYFNRWDGEAANGDSNGDSILRAAKSGGAPTQLAAKSGGPAAIAVDDSFVYYTDVNFPTITRVSKSGGDATVIANVAQLAYSTFEAATHHLALDATNVYFTAAAGPGPEYLYSVAKSGGTPVELAHQPIQFQGYIAAGPNLIFWARTLNPNGVIDSIPKVGGSLQELWNAPGTPYGLVVEPDESRLYWDDYNTGEVRSLALR